MSAFGVESTAVINIDLNVRGNLNFGKFAQQLEQLANVFEAMNRGAAATGLVSQLEKIQNQLNEVAASNQKMAEKFAQDEQKKQEATAKTASAVAKNANKAVSAEQRADNERVQAAAKAEQELTRLRDLQASVQIAAGVRAERAEEQAAARQVAYAQRAATAMTAAYDRAANKQLSDAERAAAQQEAYVHKAAGQMMADYNKAADAQEKAAKRAADAQKSYIQRVVETMTRAYNSAAQRQYNDQLKQTAEALAKAERAEISLREETERAAYANTTLKARLEALNKTFTSEASVGNRVTILMSEIGKESRLTTAQLAQYTAQVKKLEQEQMIWSKDMQTLEGRLTFFQRMIDVVYRASFRLQMTGQQLQMWARQMVGYLGNIMDTFGEFQFNLNRAAGAILDWQNAGKEGVATTQDLSNSVLDLANNLKIVPVADVAKAFYFWGSTAGETATSVENLGQQQKSLETIMKAAVLTETDYETAIKGVYSILAQYYNGAVAEATHVTESLVYAAQKTAAEFPDLINSFKMVGPIARANNVTFDDMVEIFGKLADLGIRGTMAGRAFRQFFIQIVKPSKDAAKMLQNLWASAAQTTNKYFKEFAGTSFRQMVFPGGQFVGVTKYIDMLAKATSNMTAADRNALLAKITTANELPVLTALIIQQQRALNGLSNTTKEYGANSSEAAKYFEFAWNKLATSWVGIIGSLQRGFETIKVELGTVIADTLKPFIDTAQQIINTMIEWAGNPANKQIIDFFVKLAAGGAAIAAVGGTLLAIGGALLGLGSALGYVVNVFGKFIPQTAVVVTGLAALAEGIVRNAGLLQQTFSEALTTIQKALGDTSDSFTNLGDVVSQLLAPLHDFIDLGIQIFAVSVKLAAQVAAWAIQLNKVVPILNVVLGLMGAFVSYKILAGVLGMAARISGLAKVFGVLKTAIAGATAAQATDSFIANASWLQAVPQQAAAATKEIGLMGRAISSMKGAAVSFINVVGPQGIIALAVGAGWLAYQSDFFGFRDFIDQITDHFRDLRKEIADLQAELGDTSGLLGDRARTLATEIANNNIFNFRDGNGVLDTGKMQTYINEKTTEILKMWTGAVEEVNRALSGSGRQIEQIDFNSVFNKLADSVIGAPSSVTGSQPEHTAQLQMQIAEQILELLPKGSDEATAKKVYEQLKSTYGDTFQMGWETFLKDFAPYEDFKSVQTTNQQNLADQLFNGYLSQLQHAMDSNMSDADKAKAVADILDQKLQANSFIPGAERLVGHSLLDALQGTFGASTSPEFAQKVNYILNAIGMNYEDVMTKAVDDNLSPQQSRWQHLSDLISSAIANANAIIIGQALDNLGVSSTGDTFAAGSKLGKFLDDMYSGYFDEAATILHNDIIPKLDTLPPDLQSSLKDAAKTLVESGVQNIITADDLKALGTTASDAGLEDSKSLTEVAQSYMDALAGGTDKGWKDAIKNAMKKHDVKRVGGLIRQFVDKTLLAGLTDKHSLAAQKLAMQHLQDLMDDVATVFDTPGMTANRKSHLADVVIQQINQLEKVKLPPAVKQRLEAIRAQMEAILTGHPYTPAGKKGKGKGTSGWAANLMPVDDMGNPFGTSNVPTGKGPGISTGIAPTIDTSGASTALNNLKTEADTMQSHISEKIAAAQDTAAKAGPAIPQAMAQGIAGGAGEVSSSSEALKAKATGPFETLSGIMAAFGVTVPRNMAAGIVQNQGQVSGAAQSTASLIKVPFYGMLLQATSWGIHLNENIAAGMREITSVGSVAEAAAAIAQVIYENLHHTYPEKGPLRHDAMTHSGEDAVKNFARGMSRGTRNVLGAAAGIAAGLHDSIKKHNKHEHDEQKKHHKKLSDDLKAHFKEMKKTKKMWLREIADARRQIAEGVGDPRKEYLLLEMKAWEKSLKNLSKRLQNQKRRAHEQLHHKHHHGRRDHAGLGAMTEEMGTRKVSVDINVSSKDGSVNRAQLGEIRKAAMDAFTLSGIEHMVQVG